MDQSEQKTLRPVRIRARGLEIWNQQESVSKNDGRNAKPTCDRVLGIESTCLFHQVANAERIQRYEHQEQDHAQKRIQNSSRERYYAQR